MQAANRSAIPAGAAADTADRGTVGGGFELEGDLIRRVGDYYNLATFLRQVGPPAGPYTPPGAPAAATPPA